MLIGTQDEPPTRAEAEAFLERWVVALGPRLAWFEAEVAAAGGPATDRTTQSLEPLLGFVVERIDGPAPVDPVPEWYGDVHRGYGWSAYGAAMAEGLMAYVAAVYRGVAGSAADWVLNTDRMHAHFRQPVMRVPTIAPSWAQVPGKIVRLQRGGDPGGLRKAVESVLSHWRPAGNVEQGPDLWVEVTPIRHPEWDVQVSLPEDLGHTVGEEAYASLEDRFATVPGVAAAMREDRELCLLRLVDGADGATLQQRLQAVVDDLAGAGG
jgi:hypothetical protein